MQTHRAHRAVVEWWDGQEIALCGHSPAETYSVLTRLPDDLRPTPEDTARLIGQRFAPPLPLGSRTSRRLPDMLSMAGIAGGAVYDAIVALAAVEHECRLVTRDARAKATYEAIGADVVIVL